MKHERSLEIERLVKGELADPHSLLGAHTHERGTIVRAWRPEAQSVNCLSEGGVVAKLEAVHPAGVFEGIIDDDLRDYELEVSYSDGKTFTVRDPYAYPPTLGELDLHLIAEGRHRRLHTKLGATAESSMGWRARASPCGRQRAVGARRW